MYEAGLDYLLSMLRLPRHTRERYAKQLRDRGFDISLQDVRPRPAPKPTFVHDSQDEVRRIRNDSEEGIALA